MLDQGNVDLVSRSRVRRHRGVKVRSLDSLDVLWLTSNGEELAAFTDDGDQILDFGDLFIKPPRGTLEGDTHLRVESLASTLTAEGPVALSEVLRKVATTFPSWGPEFAEGCLRLHVAGGTFEVSPGSKRVAARIGLSSSGKVREQRQAYAAAFAHDLAEQSAQVGRLIGHNPTKGSYRETLVRDLLQRHLPKRFHVATGFIDQHPGQIDILIYDQLEYSALFRSGDLVVVAAEAVRAVIEVKTNLDSAKTIKEALAHLSRVQPMTFEGPPVFAGIFAFDGASSEFVTSEIKKFYRPLRSKELFEGTRLDQSLNGHNSPFVRAVCVLKKYLLVSGFFPGADKDGPLRTPAVRKLLSISGRQPEAAIFYDRLARHLRYPWEGARPERGIGPIIGADIIGGPLTYLYKPASWGPYHLGDGAPEFMRWCDAYEGWLAGGPWELPEELAPMSDEEPTTGGQHGR